MHGLGEQAGQKPRLNSLLRIGLIVAVMLAVALLWRYSPLRAWVDPARISAHLDHFSAEAWAPLAMIGVYILAGFVFFPMLVLITATALVFEPLRAVPIALCGALCATALLYLIGARARRTYTGGEQLAALKPVAKLLKGRDVFAVVLIRMLPIAPFSLVSLGFGALAIPLRTALFGTALGMTPGMVAITAFGAQLRAVIEEPTLGKVALLVVLLLAWILLAYGLQRFASKRT